MSGFAQSTSGRLFTLAASTALLGGGAAAVIGGTTGLALLAIGLLTGIAASIVAVAFGIGDHPFETMLMVLAAPWVLFLYEVGQSVVMNYRANVGYILIALGIAALTRAIFVGEKAAAEAHPEGAHAH